MKVALDMDVLGESMSTCPDYPDLTWRRGAYDVDTYVAALRVRTGYVSSCGTWGIERLPRSWSLTHLLTGRRVGDASTLREAKDLASILSPLVAAVRLEELSDAQAIADAIVAAIGDTMRAWVAAKSGAGSQLNTT